jgi:hypothetical protein
MAGNAKPKEEPVRVYACRMESMSRNNADEKRRRETRGFISSLTCILGN